MQNTFISYLSVTRKTNELWTKIVVDYYSKLSITSTPWNAVFREHLTEYPNCKAFLFWDPTGEEKRGLVWLERAKCDRCNYLSKKFKLYEEVEPTTFCSGRKAAKSNLGLQIGLMQTPVGNSALRRVLLSANIPAPSTKGLQKTSRYVSNSIEQQNQSNMKQRRKTSYLSINSEIVTTQMLLM